MGNTLRAEISHATRRKTTYVKLRVDAQSRCHKSSYIKIKPRNLHCVIKYVWILFFDTSFLHSDQGTIALMCISASNRIR